MALPDTRALKHAAIDAYVHDLADPNLFYLDRTESQYRLMYQGYSIHFSRPDANTGQGGGVMAYEVIAVGPESVSYSTDLPDPGLVAKFDEIRSEIDALVAPFADMPGPSDFHAYMDTVASVMGCLATSEAGGGSVLGDHITELEGIASSGRLEGDFFVAFKSSFVYPFRDAVIRYYGVAMALGAALGGEQGLWDNMQKSVDDTVDRAAKAFKAHSEESAFDWNEIIWLLTVMADGLSLFAGVAALGAQAEVALPVEAIAAGITLVTDVLPHSDDPAPASTFDTLMTAFSGDIAKIISDSATQEDWLKSSLSSSYDATFGDRWKPSNGFAGQPIDQRATWGSTQLKVLDEACKRLYESPDGLLPSMAGFLESARGTVESMTDSTKWYRDDSLGDGPKGCWEDWDTLRQRLQNLLKDLWWQTDKAATILRDVVAAFRHADQDAAGDLTSLEDQLSRGSGVPHESPHRGPTRWIDHVHSEGGIGGY